MKLASIATKKKMADALRVLCLVTLCFALAAGCAQKKQYKDDEVRPVHAVVEGVVTNVSQILVSQDPDATGPLAGAVAGGVVGTVVGGTALGVVGAVAGAYAGSNGEFGPKTYQATELTIEMEDGRYLVVVIGSNEYFIKDDEVRILSMGEQYVRVQHK